MKSFDLEFLLAEFISEAQNVISHLTQLEKDCHEASK